jgi:superfamily I DNA and/or RNA helicase
MDYFKKLTELLKTEMTEDKEAYQRQAEHSSIIDRRSAGLAWYPIAITNTEPGRGDYLNVEVERKSNLDILHQLRFGSPAVLFSNHAPGTDRVEGIVSHQNGNRLKINIFTDELPDWCHNGKLGIELLFDNNSYDEMFNTLKQADKLAESANEGILVQVLTGKKKPGFEVVKQYTNAVGLNSSQSKAVEKIICARELAIVHGPPGTGKTTTLVQAISILANEFKQKILVVAPSNTAVDLLTEKLSIEGINVLRIGNPVRVSERLMELTLDHQMERHAYMKDSRQMKKQAAAYKNMAHKYKRNFGKAERDQRQALFNEAQKLMKEVDKTEKFIVDDLVTKAQVITATLAGANHYTVRNIRYDTVIIDEAGQGIEPACWIPILKGNKIVFAGDPFQLSPTIKSAEAAAGGLNKTLMEKVINLHPEAVVLLEEQYRMHESIMSYPSQVFYNNLLKAHPSVAEHLLFQGDAPFLFIDTAGCGFEEQPIGSSYNNPEEAAFSLNYLQQFVAGLEKNYQSLNFPSIAVISPYSQQVTLLKDQLTNFPLITSYANAISINTIDSFQGQERDMVLISLTRSNQRNEIGFLADIRRINVAITRAKKKVVLIGDSGTLGHTEFYSKLIAYAEQSNGYQSAWEYMN